MIAHAKHYSKLLCVSLVHMLHRALLCYVCTCPSTLYTVPNALRRCVGVIESAAAAVEGRLKSPAKTQGIICRTLLKVHHT